MVYYLAVIMFAIALVSCLWGMAYGWYRGREEAKSYYTIYSRRMPGGDQESPADGV
jgi:hypothetical protein